MGCDYAVLTLYPKKEEFQSTHPSWGATTVAITVSDVTRFQSTHPSWGATGLNQVLTYQLTISIHAPIVGCDLSKTDMLLKTI